MRTKIIAGGAIAILLVGLGSYFMVKSSVESAFVDEVDSRIGNDQVLLARSVRLTARDLVGEISEQASQGAVGEVFSALDEPRRRDRGFEQAERVTRWFGDPARGHGGPPELVAITDDQGHVVARNADRNRMFGQDLAHELPTVAAALLGNAGADVWVKQDENKVLLIAVAPIRVADRVVGTMLVGYDLSNGFAASEGEILGREVAFVANDQVYSSSLDDSTQAEALRGYLFGDGQAATTAARDAATASGAFLVSLGSTEYVGVVGPLGLPSGHVATVVLADRGGQRAKAGAAYAILGFMLVGLLIVIVYGFLLGTSLLKPIEQMEESMLAILNGRTDLRIQIESQEYGGLAYRINQLLNLFTGTPEVDESGRTSRPPPGPGRSFGQSDLESVAGESPASGGEGGGAGAAGDVDPALAARLAAEPEDAYYARVYNEYVAAKQAVGENVSNIPQDKFVQRLRANEKALMAKHGARMVRFQVETAGTQVNLKPVPIK